MTQRGSATVFAVAVSTVVIALGVAGIVVLGLVGVRIQVQTAADAAALAAAVATYEDSAAALVEARRFARANGADLELCRCPEDSRPVTRSVDVVVVTVVEVPLVGAVGIRAGSSAQFDPPTEIGILVP